MSEPSYVSSKGASEREISLRYFKELGLLPVKNASEFSYHSTWATRIGNGFLLKFCNRFQTSGKLTQADSLRVNPYQFCGFK